MTAIKLNQGERDVIQEKRKLCGILGAVFLFGMPVIKQDILYENQVIFKNQHVSLRSHR